MYIRYIMDIIQYVFYFSFFDILGMVLSMETCELRLTHDNCEVNPNSTFWMGSKDRDIYCLSYFRLFYTQGYSHREDIGKIMPRCFL